MSHDGTYESVSHFWKFFKHRGRFTIRTDGEKLTGKVYVMGMEGDMEDGVIHDDDFRFVMRKKLPVMKKPITMEVTGFFCNGTVRGTMRAPFGTSTFDATKVSDERKQET